MPRVLVIQGAGVDVCSTSPVEMFGDAGYRLALEAISELRLP